MLSLTYVRSVTYNLTKVKPEVNDKYGTDYALPVFHLAQLYGLAMGLTADDLTLDAQAIDAAPALAKALGENAK